MDKENGDIFMTSIHDWYAAYSMSWESKCLAKFSVTYDTLYGGGTSHTETPTNEITEENQNDWVVNHDHSRADVN